MIRYCALAMVLAVAAAQAEERVLIDTTVTVDGTPQPIKVVSGQDNADVAKQFALEHKLDQDGMQNVYYFLNRKAAEGGFYKKKLDVYEGFEYAGEPMPITIFEDTNAKGVAEFMGVKLNLLAEASVALQTDIERFIISKVALRMPVNLTEQGLGTQYVVVKRGESVDSAMQRFGASLKSDFGFAMNDKGIFEIKAGVTAKLAELKP